MNGTPIAHGSYKVFVHIYTNNIRRCIRYRIRFRSYMYTNGIRTIYGTVHGDVHCSYLCKRKPCTVPSTIGIPFICIRCQIRKLYIDGIRLTWTVYDAVHGVVCDAVYGVVCGAIYGVVNVAVYRSYRIRISVHGSFTRPFFTEHFVVLRLRS